MTKMLNLRQFLVLIVLLLQLSAEQNSIDDAPRLISENGNLIFQTSSTKSINFQTQNGGGIRLNNIDLKALSDEIRSMQNAMGQIRDMKNCNCDLINSKLDTYSRKIESLESSLASSNGKITSLEGDIRNIKEIAAFDDCANHPCHNGAQCIDGYNSFKCICPPNFTGKHCTEDVNECQQIAGTIHGCQNNARCENTIGSFKCICTGKWSGVLCNIPINSCSNASNIDICGHGMCYPDHSPNNPRPFKCICDSGWSLDSVTQTCINDIDECRVGKYPCSTIPYVACINTPGNVKCEDCPSGFDGNGFVCVDINECANVNTCGTNEECINSFGSYQCKCIQGMRRGMNGFCQPENLCESNNGGCNSYAVCTPNNFVLEGRVCTCNTGYIGNGIGPTGCRLESPRNNTSRDYRRCVRRQLCRNGGTCIPLSSGFKCRCLPGFTGSRCRTIINNQCLSSPCLNGGQCEFLSPNHYRCHCKPLFTGVNCENEHTECGGTYIISNEEQEIGLFTSLSSQLSGKSYRFPCVWTIIALHDQFFQIVPITLQLTGICSEEFVQLTERSTIDQTTTEIGRYCQQSNISSQSYNTTGNILIIKTQLKRNIQRNHGFRLRIIPTNIPIENLQCCKCSNDLITKTRLTNGIFQSPHFPLNYPSNTQCAMRFEREYGERYRIELQIKTLDLGNKIANCIDSDFLQIHFIEGVEVKLTACNQQLYYNKYFITSGFAVKFRSDTIIDTNTTRFQIRWRKSLIQDPCGGSVPMNPIGVLQGPAIAADDEALCTWKIQHTNTSRLLEIKGIFENWAEGDCSVKLSILKISNSGENEVVWQTCQTQNMLNKLHEQINGDIIVEFNKYKGVSTPPFTISFEYVCGQSVNMDEVSEYQFQSENYPDNYDDNLNCIYMFSAKTRKVAITFSDFDINDESPCNNDFIKIMGSNSQYRDKKYCNGNKNEMSTVSMNLEKMYVVFKTNSSISGQGFKAKATVFDCGGYYYFRNKLILGYPEGYLNETVYHLDHQYERNKNCTWEITVPPGNMIIYIFDHFHFEYHTNCIYDYLELNYDNTTKRFCGNNADNGYTKSNKLKIKFISDHSVNGEGFVLRLYVTKAGNNCHQSIEANEGVIMSPPIQFLSRPYICIYSIKVQQFKKVVLNITINGGVRSNDTIIFGPQCFGNTKLKVINGAFGSSHMADICPAFPQTEELRTSSNVATIVYLVPVYQTAPEFNYTINFYSSDDECGSVLTNSYGIISSPGYPLFAPDNSYCRWEIQTRPGKRLRILISHIRAGSVDDTGRCNDKAPVIRLISPKKEINIACTDHTTTDYVFEEPKVNIVFQNFANTRYRFRLRYNQFCVYTTNALNGRIESTNVMSWPRYFCEWTLTSLRGSSINVHIDTFDLPRPQNGNCRAYVKISDKNGDIMQNTCGNQLLNRTFSSSNLPIRIKHVTSPIISQEILRAHKGIVIEYQTEGCIETITYDPEQDDYMKKSGTLQSAQYPNSVSNIDCVWNLKTIPGYSVKFKFDVIEMESFLNCTEGPILQIWDNEIIDNNHVFQSCSRIDSGQPIEFQTSTHEVFLKFFSAKDTNGGQRKFHGYYEFVNSSCEFEMSGSEGFIQSPNYPNQYPHELRCKWNLRVRESMSIHLRFLDFETEGSYCRYDYVELFSLINDDTVKLNRLCGNPVNISSTIFDSLSNQMVVTFRSDVTVGHKGFKAKYFEACGGVRMATESSQFLFSPNYPHSYSLTDGICEWNIVANTSQIGLRIFFYFLGFEGGSNNPNCTQENSLTIIEGLEIGSPIKAVLCTKYAYHPIISNGHYLKIVLRSTSGNAIFKASYGTGSSTCGGEFYLDDGLMTSPFYPNAVNMDLDCIYIIRNSPGSFIDLNFVDFSRHSATAYFLHDFIEIRDGSMSNSSLIERFYHLEDLRNLTNIFKFYNSVWMRLRSQGGNFTNDIKFMATYHINYVNEFRSDKGILASPQFGHVYNEDTDISWTINGETIDTLLITFDQFSVGRILINGECSRGRLTITDSNNNVKVFCGSTIIPPGKYSTPIIIRLTAEGYRYPGFQLQWSIPSNDTHRKIGECNYIIQASKDTQYLTSPNYPNFDPEIRSCKWTIISDENGAIEIQMLNFTLEDSTDCKFENFTVSIQGIMNSPLLHLLGPYRRIFCGSPHLSNFDIFKHYIYNKIEITYKSDEADYFPGFRLSYKLACYKRISDSIEGWLQNDEYPQPLTEDKNCTYVFNFDFFRNIILNFTSLNLPPKTNGQCKDGYLLISTDRIDEKYCGSVIPSNLNNYMTNSSSVLIRLVGNFSRFPTYSGFQLMYRLEDTEECGGNHQLTRIGEYRIINNAPAHHFANFIECKWLFTSPYGSRMQIDFEELRIMGNCSLSFLAFYEGRTILSERIGGKNYCNKRNSLFTTGNNLMIIFKNWNTFANFKLKISLSECGGLFVRPKGVISSPNFPLNYPQNSNCVWRIKGRRSGTIKLKFLEMRLDNDCSKSNITIISVEDSGNVVYWNNCNYSSWFINIDNGEVIIMFSTKTITTYKGFKLQYQMTSFMCGGIFDDPSKELKSVNFPRSLPSNRRCFWMIEVDASKKIVINIKKLTIIRGCLKIENYEAGYQQRICNRNLENYEIDTNLYSVNVALWNYNGASISFSYHSNLPALCGSHIYPNINATGHILMENINISLCKHIIHNYPEDEGTVSFKNVILRGLNSTENNYILRSQIARDNYGALWDFGSACQNKNTKNSFVTFGKKIEFLFYFPRLANVSDYKVDLFYKYHQCGKLLVEPFGHIQSPGYPNKYPNNANCEWLIKAPVNMQIQLIIRTLHLEHHQTCDYDYLFIRYGAEFNSPPFRMFCGKNQIDNETLTFYNNQLRISFHSDFSVIKDGFYLEYSFINPVDNCNGIIFNAAGSIKSPNYPRPYPSNLRCNWTVVVPSGYRVSLTFQAPFDLERTLQNKCTYDSLKIFDTNATILLADLCGNIPPSKPIISSKNQITLLFSTDFNHNLDGFHAQYQSICGGLFNDTFGEIVSPTEFIGTRNRLKCEYIITGWQNHLTVLRISSNIKRCYYSQMEILLEMRNGQFVLSRKICSTSEEITILHGKSIKIQYTTLSYRIPNDRFRASYLHDENVKVLKNVIRPVPIKTPHFPTPYHHNANLTWKLYAPVGYIFYVRIKSVDIEPSALGCTYDFVSFWSENSTSSPSIFCGKQTDIFPFKVNSNSLIIQFQSDSSHYENHTGFNGVVFPTPGPSLGCGGFINVTEGISGVISSIDLDNNGKYDNNLICEWQLQTEIGRAIQLTFENNSVNMEKRSRDKCRYDYLEIFDGPDSVRPLIQILCGDDQTDPITSQSNAMFISFISDSTIIGRGFKLTYTSIASLNHVVKIATNSTQILQSPDYPNDSPYDFRFMGEISTPNDSDHILVTITDLKIRSSANCSIDKFRIQDVSLKYFNKIKTFCKSITSPYKFISSHNKLVVQYMIGPMESVNTLPNKRFQIDYKLYSCNRTEQAYSGSLINIENFKQTRYSHNLYCNLTLIAPTANLRYQFYFKRFYLERSSTCGYDYIQFIFGGPNEPQYILPKLCGSSLPASFISNSSRVTMLFVTDYSVNHDGYEITYVINKDPLIKCGGEIEVDSGVITSPGFGQNYYESGECTWKITIMSSSQIKWKFTDLQLGNSTNLETTCYSDTDFVKVSYDGQDSKYCGYMVPVEEFSSSSPTMTVQYKSVNGGTGAGFRLIWEAAKIF